MKNSKNTLADQILRISNKLLFLEKKSILEYGDIKLFPSEIHLITTIDEGQDINASKMAVRLGVTKGAVSQTLARLEKKGILYKTKDPQNRNELTVHFTALGKEILKKNQKKRTSVHKQYTQYFSDISEKERRIISDFLTKMEKFFDSVV